MNLQSIGVQVTSTRTVGQCVWHSCSLTTMHLHDVLSLLPVGGELSVPDVGLAECFREARRGVDGFEIKRGCHGAHGTWRSASLVEVEAWLLPGIEVAARARQLGYELAAVMLPA